MHPRIALIAVLAVALSGCLASTPSDPAAQGPTPVPAPDRAAPALPETITGLDHIGKVPDVEPGASGLWIQDGWAYVSGFSSNAFHVVDLSDPTSATVVGTLEGPMTRDAAHLEVGDRELVVASADGDGLHVIDVTDKADPWLVRTLDLGSHNVAVLPDSTLVYNSDSLGKGSTNEILDFADPEAPEVVATFGDRGCHDIEFHLGEDASYLYCPGVSATEIWEITDDPLDPKLVATIHNPLISAPGAVPGRPDVLAGPLDELGPGAHHWATPARDGDLLIVGDEFTGAIAPGCGLHAEPAGRSLSDPLGALWFYDTSDPADPQLRGWIKMTAPADNTWNREWIYPSCTAHFGEVIEGRDKVVAAWFHAGTVLVDFADPSNPVVVDRFQEDSAVWDARLHGRYIVTGDSGRGSDVLELVG